VIDGAMAVEPTQTLALHGLKIAKMVVDVEGGGAPLFKEYAYNGMWVRSAFLKDRPQVARGIVAAVVEAEQAINDPARIDDIIKVGATYMKAWSPTCCSVISSAIVDLPAGRHREGHGERQHAAALRQPDPADGCRTSASWRPVHAASSRCPKRIERALRQRREPTMTFASVPRISARGGARSACYRQGADIARLVVVAASWASGRRRSRSAWSTRSGSAARCWWCRSCGTSSRAAPGSATSPSRCSRH
jgi:hypothetical protein